MVASCRREGNCPMIQERGVAGGTRCGHPCMVGLAPQGPKMTIQASRHRSAGGIGVQQRRPSSASRQKTSSCPPSQGGESQSPEASGGHLLASSQFCRAPAVAFGVALRSLSGGRPRVGEPQAMVRLDRPPYGHYLSLQGLGTGAPKKGRFWGGGCLLYTSPSPRDKRQSRMPSSA